MVPEWKGGPFEQWSRNFVRRNKWRVAHRIGDTEDCMQECALKFAYVCNKYGDVADTPQWIMALFKTAVINHWNSLAVKDARERNIELDPEDEVVYPPTSVSGIMGAASEALQIVLKTIGSAPSEVMDLLLPEEPLPDRLLNRRWRRLLNLPQDSYPASELRRLINGDEASSPPRITMKKNDDRVRFNPKCANQDIDAIPDDH